MLVHSDVAHSDDGQNSAYVILLSWSCISLLKATCATLNDTLPDLYYFDDPLTNSQSPRQICCEIWQLLMSNSKRFGY